jgi:hypothetical protein
MMVPQNVSVSLELIMPGALFLTLTLRPRMLFVPYRLATEAGTVLIEACTKLSDTAVQVVAISRFAALPLGTSTDAVAV